MESKSKSHLALMEQAIMILVFAFAAALCVQAFQKADAMSQNLENRDRAVNLSQIVAETMKALSGDMQAAAETLDGEINDQKLFLRYDKEWNPATEEKAVYVLCLNCTETGKYLGKAEITVEDTEDEEVIFCLPVSWQREVPHE